MNFLRIAPKSATIESEDAIPVAARSERDEIVRDLWLC